MTHYVCSGNCNTVLKHPDVCSDKDCDQYAEALDPCDCEDEKHLKKLEENKKDYKKPDESKK